LFLLLAMALFLPALFGGIGVLSGRPRGRLLIIIVSALMLLAFPIGTVLGAGGPWILLSPLAMAGSAGWPVGRLRSCRLQGRLPALLVAVCGIPAGFVFVIGLGFRVTGQAAPVPIAQGFLAGCLVLGMLLAWAVMALGSAGDIAAFRAFQTGLRARQQRGAARGSPNCNRAVIPLGANMSRWLPAARHGPTRRSLIMKTAQ
jgi:hypothetical protein